MHVENIIAYEEKKLRQLIIVKWMLVFAFLTLLILTFLTVKTPYENWGRYCWFVSMPVGLLLIPVGMANSRILANTLKLMEGFSSQKTYSNKSFGIGIDTERRRIGLAGRSKKGQISVRMIEADDILECDVKLKSVSIVTEHRKLSESSAIVGGLMFGPMGAIAASVLGSGKEKESHNFVKSILLYLVLKESEELVALDFLIDHGGLMKNKDLKKFPPYDNAYKLRDIIVELVSKNP